MVIPSYGPPLVVLFTNAVMPRQTRNSTCYNPPTGGKPMLNKTRIRSMRFPHDTRTLRSFPNIRNHPKPVRLIVAPVLGGLHHHYEL